jgi:predicted ATPase/DNA-binding winged helix-turn-helix (wHTH) protein
MSAMDTTYHFHHYQLQPAQRQLLEGGRPVKLGGRAFDMLVVLIERRDRVVGKHELMDLVWPRLVVEENNLQVQVLTLRKLLGHGAISTVPGRGYRFTLPVRAEGETPASDAAPSATTAAAAPEPGREGNLREHAPELLGRDSELRELQGLIDRHAVVTVTGAGGIGKTRLAQGAAAGRAPQQAVWWVELAPLADPALVPAAVARALALPLAPQDDATAAVVQALQGKAALLVLDNAEHLLDAVAAFVATLRERAAGVKLLVTSQEVMRGFEEQVYRPGPLALPQGDDLVAVQASGAVALFVARARQADPRFQLRDDNRAAVADICRRLDGIPLAIELAAARVPLLGVEGLRQRLDERFQVLTAGSRAVMRRHQTLRAALEWSHALLTTDEQRVFRRLGVFAGGFTLEGAQAVAADDHIDAWDLLEHLGALVDKSLVAAEGDPLPRYRLLETTRLYALERLAETGETDGVLRQHAGHCIELAEAFEADAVQHGKAARALDRLDAERDNLLHALAWCGREGDAEAAATGLRLVAALRYYWGARGLLGVGLAATQLALDRAATLPGDRYRCMALGSASQMLHWMRRGAEGEALTQELLALGEAIDFAPAVAMARIHQGYLAAQRSEWAAAQGHFEAVLAVARRIDSLHHEGNALGGLADILICQGRPDEAAARLEELLMLRRRAGHGYNLAVTLQRVAAIALERGDTARCTALLTESQPWVRGAGSRVLIWGWCSLVGSLAVRHGQWDVAVQLQASVARFRADDGLRPDDNDLQTERAEMDRTRAALGDAAYEAAWAAGTALGAAQVLDLAASALAACAEPPVAGP